MRRHSRDYVFCVCTFAFQSISLFLPYPYGLKCFIPLTFSFAVSCSFTHCTYRVGQWVLRNLPSNVNHVRSWSAYHKEYVAGRDFLTLPTCVLVSNKPSVPPLFAALSREYAKHFDFLFVSTKDGDDAKVWMRVLVRESNWNA